MQSTRLDSIMGSTQRFALAGQANCTISHHPPGGPPRPVGAAFRPQCKAGVLLLIDGKSEPHEVRLRLSKDVLTIQHQDVLCISEGHNNSKERTVTLRRQDVGGFGLSIKGGAEHRVPVVISKIVKNQAADQSGRLFVGDAILRVNGINVENAAHEEVVQVLRNAGDEVTLTVIYLKKIPAFLKLPLIEEVY
uniref:gamma-1-syntrophin-like n=1 Tax=Myxine glutinosa TaxID=7769 RepID=UPI00358FB234